MKTAASIPLNESLAFFARWLPRRARVLEVGAGAGALAISMRKAGHDVTAIDASPDAVRAAKRARAGVQLHDVLEPDGPYARGPFDAALYTRSLHHVADLKLAVSRTVDQLKPGGLIILEEFAHDEMDLTTATWFYDMLEGLATAGAVKLPQWWHPGHAQAHGHGHGHGGFKAHDRGDFHARSRTHARPKKHGQAFTDPLSRWRHWHSNHAPMHGGDAMRAAIARAGKVEFDEKGPYLYRYVCDNAAKTAAGRAAGAWIQEREREHLAAGRLAALGRRIVVRTSPKARR